MRPGSPVSFLRKRFLIFAEVFLCQVRFFFVLARNFIFVFLHLAIACARGRDYSISTMKSVFARLIAQLNAKLNPQPFVYLHVKEVRYQGNFSKLYVYVSDAQLSRTIEHITGTRTLLARHMMALHAMGFRFHLPRPQAITVPAWLPQWLS